MGTIQTNLGKIETGLKDGSIGATKARQGLAQIKASSETILAGSKQLLAGYQQSAAGIGQLLSNYNDTNQKIDNLHQTLIATDGNFANVENSYNGIGGNPDYQAIKKAVKDAQDSTTLLAGTLNYLNANLKGAEDGINFANSNLGDLIAGQQSLVNGLDDLLKGISNLEAGLNTLADGQGQIVSNIPQVSSGLVGLKDGQQQILSGFQGLGGQITQLTDGLTQSANGLHEVSKGLNSAQDYLTDVSKEKNNGFYIPQNVLDGKDFAKVLDTYMSRDRKVMTIDVVFNKNPYANEAIDRISEIKQTVKRVIKDTKLENAQVAVGGVTSIHKDLDTMSKGDYSRTVVLMLSGIAIILIILLRSFIMPLYLIGSLILTYYTSMAISEKIFVNIFGYTGISWAVPFFAFVILIALGIDYSIFLMDRFNEYRNMPVEKAILQSMKKMGTVIISAAIILGGTFAAMMPSGVLSLLEIATILLIGLSLYALVILPLFIPVMVKTFGEANWWPFRKNKDIVTHSNEM
jgi:RND superfamily putative drug exporter